MKPQHFIIQEYNRKTQQYITVGDAWGTNAETAKLNFIEQSNWKPQRNVILFVQHPVCR
jgi:hypothetical protein